MKKFDINIDIGEGFEIEKDLMPLIQSCNIACGGHAGSTNEIKKCIADIKTRKGVIPSKKSITKSKP